MTDDLDTLRLEVATALGFIERNLKYGDGTACEGDVEIIRAELQRLANENADLQLRKEVDIEQSVEDHKWHCDEEDRLRDRAEKVEAELAALKARIAEAPIAQVRRILMWPESDVWTSKIEPSCSLPKEWDNTRVRLVVEE